MSYRVRRLRASEFRRWRDLRLRALRDSPGAFGSRHEDQAAWPLSRWRERTAVLAAAEDQIMLVGEAPGGHLAGCAGGHTAPDGVPGVISLWIEPESRRRGLATMLLEAIAEWARGRGARRLTLYVVRGNEAAVGLYARFGFRSTGETGVDEQGRIEDRMWLDLAGDAAEADPDRSEMDHL